MGLAMTGRLTCASPTCTADRGKRATTLAAHFTLVDGKPYCAVCRGKQCAEAEAQKVPNSMATPHPQIEPVTTSGGVL